MNLPQGYEVMVGVHKDLPNRLLLMQDVEVFQPLGEYASHPRKEYDMRPVAGFTEDATPREIERVATLDVRTQSPGLTSKQRARRMRELVAAFDRTEARL